MAADNSTGETNSLPELMRFLSTPDRPVKSAEFQEFWKELTDEEKDEFKNTELKQ